MNIQVLNQLKFTGKTLYGKIAISKQSISNFRFANNKNTLLNLSCMVQQGSYKPQHYAATPHGHTLIRISNLL
jgi:hypothetical protein